MIIIMERILQVVLKLIETAPRIDVLVNDIVFGQNAIVNIVLPADVNDTVIFSVDDASKKLLLL